MRIVFAVPLVGLVIGVSLLAAPAQEPTVRTGVKTGLIAGHVVDGSTGQPVAGATVTLNHQPPASVGSPGSSPAQALRMPTVNQTTSQDGQFQFDALPVGSFRVRASAGGYRIGFFGQQSSNDSYGSNARIDLAAGDRLTDVTIRTWPTSSISGIVTDERGETIVGARVLALHRDYLAGGPAWIRSRAAWPTDDRGAYVLRDLAPGEYLIALQGSRNEMGSVGYNPTFYPASRRASAATPLTLTSGQARTDVNITATIRPAAHQMAVAGRVVGDGSPLPPITLSLVPPDAEDSVIHLEAITTAASRTGAFRFPSVPMGEYRLVAAAFPSLRGGGVGTSSGLGLSGFTWSFPTQPPNLTSPPESPTWVLDRPITVEGPVENVEVPLQQGARLRGRVVFEGGGTTPAIEALRGVPLLVRPAHVRDLGNVPVGGVEADGRFHTIGLPPGRYALMLLHHEARSASELRNWDVISIRVGGRETIGSPIELDSTDVRDVELVLSNRRKHLSGVVQDANGRPVPWARIIVFPRDQTLWGDYIASPAPRRIAHIVADRFGAFNNDGRVPPGEYLLAAVMTAPEHWMAPDFLASLAPAATPVTLEPGDRRVVTLRIVP